MPPLTLLFEFFSPSDLMTHLKTINSIECNLEKNVKQTLASLNERVPRNPITFERENHPRLDYTTINASMPTIPLRLRDLLKIEELNQCEIFVQGNKGVPSLSLP